VAHHTLEDSLKQDIVFALFYYHATISLSLSHTHTHTHISVVQVSEMTSNCYWVSGRFLVLRKSEDWFAYITVNLNKPKTHLEAYGYLSNLSSKPWVV
jgi:hypothetical protein